MTFWETIEWGEYVMFALALIVLACLIILWVRSASLSRNKKRTKLLMQKVRDYIMEGDVDNARQLSGDTATSGGRLVATGLSKMGEPLSEVKDTMKETSEIEKEKMASGLRWLHTMAVVAPLLGLGGTLVGIIDRLRDLGDSGAAADISAVCGAIAPTIVTTVAGLVVGILALVCQTILEGVIARARIGLEEVKEEFIGLLNEPAV